MTTDADAARTFGQLQYVLATGTAGSPWTSPTT